jgi:hypothetical protein
MTNEPDSPDGTMGSPHRQIGSARLAQARGVLFTLPARTGSVRGQWQALPWLLAGLFFALYTMLSVTNHLRLGTTGYDLGIFEQAVRGYAEGRAPVSDLKARVSSCWVTISTRSS